ncbi:MAG: glycerophosphodiester phosphodiesterase [Spirochaetota bacterium]
MFLIIGHRGASGYEPENTLSAFKKAIDLKADMIEMDIYKCKTGELVLIHDNNVNRTTNGKGYVQDFSLKELKSLETGKGDKIPLLEEVLDLADRKIKINLELKGVDTAEPSIKIIEKYVNDKGWRYEDFYISSFNHYLLNEVNSLCPVNSGIKICPLIYGLPVGLAKFAVRLNAYSINISSDFVNKELLKDAHKRGMKIFVYVVNDAAEALKLKSLGVDGIFTDYPDLLIKQP